jgi:hypothetical protein
MDSPNHDQRYPLLEEKIILSDSKATVDETYALSMAVN